MYSHKFTLLDYSKESTHGTWGTINYLKFLNQIWVEYGEQVHLWT